MDKMGSSSSSKESRLYELFKLIHDGPNLPNKRKNPRTLTACDRCRTRKVKCEQFSSSERCDACTLAHQECTFKARDQRLRLSTTTHLSAPSVSPQGNGTDHNVRQDRKDLQSLRGEVQPPLVQTTAASETPVVNKATRCLNFVSTASATCQRLELTPPEAISRPSSAPLRPSSAPPRITMQKSLSFDHALLPIHPIHECLPDLSFLPHEKSIHSLGGRVLPDSDPFLIYNFTEDATQQTYVSSDDTPDGGNHSYPALENLMAIHTPEDLSGQVVIPNYRNPAKGGLSDVYSGNFKRIKVAVKVFRMSKRRKNDAHSEESNERRVRREMHVWAALKHQNICELLGYSTDFSDYPALWCPRGTSVEYLENPNISVAARIKLAQDVCEGLQYLHQLSVIHGDIKPTNVLVDADGVAKLCDFGLVRLAGWEGPAGMTTTSPYTGTVRYKAPELFISTENRRPLATFEGDIYSVGCIMLEFIEQLYPFQRFQGSQELGEAIMEKLPPALRAQTSHSLSESTGYFWDLLEACWDAPSGRPAIDVIIDALARLALLHKQLMG